MVCQETALVRLNQPTKANKCDLLWDCQSSKSMFQLLIIICKWYCFTKYVAYHMINTEQKVQRALDQLCRVWSCTLCIQGLVHGAHAVLSMDSLEMSLHDRSHGIQCIAEIHMYLAYDETHSDFRKVCVIFSSQRKASLESPWVYWCLHLWMIIKPGTQ